MESSESIARLFEIINSKLGPLEAKKAVIAAVGLTLNELLDQSKEINSKNLDEALENYVNDFIEANKSNVA